MTKEDKECMTETKKAKEYMPKSTMELEANVLMPKKIKEPMEAKKIKEPITKKCQRAQEVYD